MSRKPKMTAGSGGDVPLSPKQAMTKAFGRRLSRLVFGKGWSQADFSRHTGIPKDSISIYMNGKSMPYPARIEKMARALSVAPSVLVPSFAEASPEADIVPHLDFKAEPGGGAVLLRVNARVSMQTATKVAELIGADEISKRK